MKTFLAVAAGMLALAVVPAGAADLGLPTKAPVAAYNWTGFYFGGNGGYGNGEDLFTDLPPAAPFGAFTTNMAIKSNGFFGGGQAGFNYQFSSPWVVGVEADADASGINGGAGFCAIVGNCTSTTVRLDDFGTLRGRLGYAWNNVLVYATGGWAWGQGKVNSSTTSGAIVDNTNNMSGWTAGAGLEVGLLSFPGWTVRLEYLHIQFDNVTDLFPAPITTRTVGIASVSAVDRFDTLRFGVNYLFNFGPAPIMPR